jgi:2-dehydropantoate 2-reductase
MRIAVMGAGAVGGYYGSLLAMAGNEVTLIARGAHLAAIQAGGLRIESAKSGNFVVRCPASNDPAEVGAVDLVLLTTRTHNNAETFAAIRPLLGPETRILTVQNGVESAEELAEVYGWETVIPGVTWILARIREPGVIAEMGAPVGGGCIIYFGEHDGKETDSAKRVWEVLKGADIDARLSPFVFSEIWEKYLFNSGIGPFLRLAGAPAGEVFARKDMMALAEGMAREMIAVARAKGIRIDDEVVERTLSRLEGMAREMPAFESRPVPPRPGEAVPTASVTRLGKELGVETPITDVITAVVGLSQERLASQA